MGGIIVFHVMPGADGKWQVTREGESPVGTGSLHNTREEAVARADELGTTQTPSIVKIHGSDGRVERIHSHPPAPAAGNQGPPDFDRGKQI